MATPTWIGVEVPKTLLHLVGTPDLPHHKYRRKVSEFCCVEDAKAWQQAARQSVRRGRAPDMQTTEAPDTFASVADSAVPHVFAGQRDRTAIKTHVTRLKEYFGPMPLASIRKIDVVRMADDLAGAGKSPSTINHTLSKLNKIMNWACERGLVEDPPTYRFKGSGRQRARVFTDSECDELVRRLYEIDDEAGQFCEVLLDTGGRYSETAQLRWTDVDDFAYVRFRSTTTKTGKARSIPLRDMSANAMRQAWRERGHEDGPFVRMRNYKAFSRPWARVKTDMGLADDEDFTPHSLRHTCLTRLAASGMSLPRLKSWGGWASYQMVARYEHLESGIGLREELDRHASSSA